MIPLAGTGAAGVGGRGEAHPWAAMAMSAPDPHTHQISPSRQHLRREKAPVRSDVGKAGSVFVSERKEIGSKGEPGSVSALKQLQLFLFFPELTHICPCPSSWPLLRPVPSCPLNPGQTTSQRCSLINAPEQRRSCQSVQTCCQISLETWLGAAGHD